MRKIDLKTKLFVTFTIVSLMLVSVFSLKIILPKIQNYVAGIITAMMVLYMAFIYIYFLFKRLK